MGYHTRIESKDKATFVTTRTRRSELWFANNQKVEELALARLAKYTNQYQARLYAFTLEGSHYHQVAHFPLMNRSDFARDFNSTLATGVARHTPNYPGGGLWARRYSGEVIAGDQDIEHQFFYTVLQPVKDGLVPKLSEYPFYNCFNDAVCGIKRKYKLINWTRYNAARRYNPDVPIKDYLEAYILNYQRLPGYEHLSQHEYRVLMGKKLEEHRLEIIRKREAEGKFTFVGREALMKIVPGTSAKSPKLSNITSHRPRVLSICNQRRADTRAWYFNIRRKHKEASHRYLAGDLMVEFPPGTCRPPLWLAVMPAGPFSVL